MILAIGTAAENRRGFSETMKNRQQSARPNVTILNSIDNTNDFVVVAIKEKVDNACRNINVKQPKAIIITIWMLLTVQIKLLHTTVLFKSVWGGENTVFPHNGHSCCQVTTLSWRAPWQWSTQVSSKVCNCRVTRRPCERSSRLERIWTTSSVQASNKRTWGVGYCAYTKVY